MITKAEWLSIWSLARRGRDRQYQALPDRNLHIAVSRALYGCDPLADKLPGSVLRQQTEKRRWAARRADPMDPINAAQWNCRCVARPIDSAKPVVVNLKHPVHLLIGEPNKSTMSRALTVEVMCDETGSMTGLVTTDPGMVSCRDCLALMNKPAPINYNTNPFSKANCLCDFCMSGLPNRCEFKPKVTGPAGGYADGDSYRQEDDK